MAYCPRVTQMRMSLDHNGAVLESVVTQYRSGEMERFFRADSAFANPEAYAFLGKEKCLYTIRLPPNDALDRAIHLPDDGGGGAGNSVPVDFGTDWTASSAGAGAGMMASRQSHARCTKRRTNSVPW